MLGVSNVSYHAWLVIPIFKIFFKNKIIVYSSSDSFQDQLPVSHKDELPVASVFSRWCWDWTRRPWACGASTLPLYHTLFTYSVLLCTIHFDDEFVFRESCHVCSCQLWITKASLKSHLDLLSLGSLETDGFYGKRNV